MNVTGQLESSPFKPHNFDQSDAGSPLDRNIESKQHSFNQSYFQQDQTP